VEELLQHQQANLAGSYESEQVMRGELNDLKAQLRGVMAELGGSPRLSKIERRGKRDEVVTPCPSCGGLISYRQKAEGE